MSGPSRCLLKMRILLMILVFPRFTVHEVLKLAVWLMLLSIHLPLMFPSMARDAGVSVVPCMGVDCDATAMGSRAQFIIPG